MAVSMSSPFLSRTSGGSARSRPSWTFYVYFRILLRGLTSRLPRARLSAAAPIMSQTVVWWVFPIEDRNETLNSPCDSRISRSSEIRFGFWVNPR